MTRIVVLGVAEGGPIGGEWRERVGAASLIAGAARHLALFSEARGERLIIGNNVAEIVERLRQALAAGETPLVLATGDPLLFGIGATLRRDFSPEQLEIIPAVSSVQRAFAAVAEPWHDALILSAHGRPLEAVLAALVQPRKAAILTDPVHTPAVLAQRLLEVGSDCPAAVGERLGTPEQRVVRGRLSEIALQTFDALSVLMLLPEQVAPEESHAFGSPDDSLEHDGLITHLEVRAASIAHLGLKPESVVWDIGAGSGAVAIDAARVAYRGLTYAVERDPARYERLCRNVAAHGAGRVRVLEGEAPEACLNWPAPDAVFIGGSGGRLEAIVKEAAGRLRPKGRIVINLVMLERVGETKGLLNALGFVTGLSQVSVARSRSLPGGDYLAALNPVWIVVGAKTS